MDPLTGVLAAEASIGVAKFAYSAFTTAIKALYGIVNDINAFIDEHIAAMKASENLTVSRVGAILEAAKFGFGLGYMSSVVVMAGGQLLLGNTLAAVGEVAAAATLSNPIAMTCAAVGAIYFGWNALSDDEKNSIIERLQTGLNLGGELIKSILRFVIDRFKELHDKKIFEEMRKAVYDGAALFGRKLSDVTRSARDRAEEITDAFTARVSSFGQTIAAATMSSGAILIDGTWQVASGVKERVGKGVEAAGRLLERGEGDTRPGEKD